MVDLIMTFVDPIDNRWAIEECDDEEDVSVGSKGFNTLLQLLKDSLSEDSNFSSIIDSCQIFSFLN